MQEDKPEYMLIFVADASLNKNNSVEMYIYNILIYF